MITTLTGPNVFLVSSFVDEQKNKYLKKFDSMSVEQIDCEEEDAQKITDALINLPFLVPEKLLVLRNPSSNKQFVDVFEKIIPLIPDVTRVLIVEDKLDKRSSFFKLLKSETEFKEFKEPDVSTLTRWLQGIVKEKSGTINSVDSKLLIERVGVDQARLGNEVDKLLNYDSSITKKTIELLVDRSIQSTIFELIENAVSGRAGKALTLYEEQKKLGVDAHQVIAVLAWQLQVVATIKSSGNMQKSDIATRAKINPYVLTKSMSLAKDIDFANIKKHIQDLYDLDTKSKSKSVDVDQNLQWFIMSLSKAR
ncbi:MAG: DNA polymerase III subunit delta [Candidatus Saccharimonadales bacterium]